MKQTSAGPTRKRIVLQDQKRLPGRFYACLADVRPKQRA